MTSSKTSPEPSSTTFSKALDVMSRTVASDMNEMAAVIDALEAHETMSTQAINSKAVQSGLRDILLGPAQLYETLRAGPD